MDYGRYRTEFFARRSAIQFPGDCTNQEPLFQSSVASFWTFTWVLPFTDNHYVRIWEHFCKIKNVPSSRRHGFSYHYGPVEIPGNFGGDYRHGAPVIMRVDLPPSGEPAHLHYLTHEPRYEQTDVRGLILESLGMFSWLTGIFEHRRTKKPLHEVLRFGV